MGCRVAGAAVAAVQPIKGCSSGGAGRGDGEHRQWLGGESDAGSEQRHFIDPTSTPLLFLCMSRRLLRVRIKKFHDAMLDLLLTIAIASLTSHQAAGYCMYGSMSYMMITLGKGVAGFTLDPALGTSHRSAARATRPLALVRGSPCAALHGAALPPLGLLVQEERS